MIMNAFPLLLLLAAAARADVREIKSMAEIVPEIRSTTLLVLDIDNTLVEPVGNIGSDQWYYYLEKIGMKPTRVVFADDKPHHAKSVDAALTVAGIACVAFRYGAADEKVRAFKEVMSEAQDKAGAEMLFHGREPAP